jgi:MFS family permease
MTEFKPNLPVNVSVISIAAM